MEEIKRAVGTKHAIKLGEILGLRWCDVDFKDKTIKVCNQLIPTSQGLLMSSPKTEESIRVINAPDELVDLLKRQWKKQEEYKHEFGDDYKDHNLIICLPDREMVNPSNFSKQFANMLKQNSLKHIRFHDLRHSCATLMLSIGVPLKVASKLLGHSTVGTTADIYTHVLDDMKKDASDKISIAIFGRETVNEAQTAYSVAVGGD